VVFVYRLFPAFAAKFRETPYFVLPFVCPQIRLSTGACAPSFRDAFQEIIRVTNSLRLPASETYFFLKAGPPYFDVSLPSITELTKPSVFLLAPRPYDLAPSMAVLSVPPKKTAGVTARQVLAGTVALVSLP